MATKQVKKTTTKASQNKIALKKRTTRKKEMVSATPECAFWVYNGPIVGNLEELACALSESITDDQFAYHVTPEKNDFAQWAADVLRDSVCARALHKAKTKKAAARAAIACLKKYS